MLQPSLGVSSLDLGRPPGRPLFVCVVGRRRISPEFVEEVAEWLSGAGMTLLSPGPSWPSHGEAAQRGPARGEPGLLNFSTLERLLAPPKQTKKHNNSGSGCRTWSRDNPFPT
jgi:hypothetical protein